MTNIDFEAWGEYLGDPPLAMAFLDRIVDGAIILKINGKSYRPHRAQPASSGGYKRASKLMEHDRRPQVPLASSTLCPFPCDNRVTAGPVQV